MVMGVSLQFLGVGRGQSIRGSLSDAGFIVASEKTKVLVDLDFNLLMDFQIKDVNDIVMTGASDMQKAGVVKVKGKSGAVVERKSWGALIVVPDARIAYVIDSVQPTEVGACDVLVLVKRDESLIEKTKPKLVILTGFDSKEWEANPVYAARDIKAKTGVQTIAAEDGLVVDLASYGAVSEQKSLGKF